MILNLSKMQTSCWVVCILLLIPQFSRSQDQGTEELSKATLEQVIQYAIKHQPALKEAQIDEEITNKAIKGKLAEWYPQINFNYNYQRFIDLQSSVIGGNVIRFGVNNTSSAQFTATQNVFNRDVLLASSTASKVRMQSQQNTSRSKIDLVVNVTKAFYDVLTTMRQIEVSEESIKRLELSLKDAKSRYNSGITDKTDYQRATILLSNANTDYYSNKELLKYKEQNLKMLMGYTIEKPLSIQYDIELMENETLIDTVQQIDYNQHIDHKILQTNTQLQDANLKYSKWGFLPTVSLFGAYNLNYQNDNFGDLYNTRFPYSYVGASISLPIFQGGKRTYKVQEQRWTSQKLDVEMVDLESKLTTEYARSLSTYKSNLHNYQTQKANVDLAEEVYNVIRLQYQSGVKSYLDVTIAESDLRTTKINYFNALYRVLASKMDVERALGQINY